MAIKPPVRIPEQIGRYRIIKSLGEGGMGSVYLAQDTELDRLVAMKVPHPSDDDGSSVLERFFREARAVATLRHPHICPLFDIGESGGVHYLTMAYIEGKTLSDVVRSKPLTQRQTALLVRKLALAVQEAHQRGIIHRDLKPSNIMIDKRGEPIVMDFGLARRVSRDDTRLTQSGAVIGTPAYMPPEQISANAETMGPACDIYSLGVILYELLTGRLPFSGDTFAMLAQILTDEPPRPSAVQPGVDATLETICRKAMAKQPEQRYRSMAEMAVQLLEYLRGNTAPPLAATQTLPVEVKETQASGIRVSMLGGLRSMAQAGREINNAAAPAAKAAPRRKPRRTKMPRWAWMLIGGGALSLLLGIIAIAWSLSRHPPVAEIPSVPESKNMVTPLPTRTETREEAKDDGRNKDKAVASHDNRSKESVDSSARQDKQAADLNSGAATMLPNNSAPATHGISGGKRPDDADSVELTTLKELPTNAYHSAPWLSPDGLTLYWQSTPLVGERLNWIWCADRKNKDAQFENVRKLLQGSHPTVTGDGLEMIYLYGASFFNVTRTTPADAFGHPRKIAEFDGQGFLVAPCFNENGLVLYAERNVGNKLDLFRFTRATRRDPWGKPLMLKVTAPGPSILRFFHITADGSRGFGCIPDRLKDRNSNNLVMFSSKDQGKTLESPVFIELPGQTVQGRYPHYVAATRELFFSGEINAKGEAAIHVIRNFDPVAAAPGRCKELHQVEPRLMMQTLLNCFPTTESPPGWVVSEGTNLSMHASRNMQWTMKNGVLHSDTTGKTWFRSEKQYGDFILEFELKMPERGNSGVALRTPTNGHPAYDGLELQIADYTAVPIEATGALFAVLAPRKQVYRPAQWNTFRIEMQGPHLLVTINGEVVQDVNLNEHTQPLKQGKTGTALPLRSRPKKGHLGFQNNAINYQLMIRKARIKELH